MCRVSSKKIAKNFTHIILFGVSTSILKNRSDGLNFVTQTWRQLASAMKQMLFTGGTGSSEKWSKNQITTITFCQADRREARTPWNFLGCHYLRSIKFCSLLSQAYRTQFAFEGRREHIAKVNITNIAYLNQHIDIEIPHGSTDHVIVPDTVKIMFNLDITSTDKARSVVNNAGRALVKKEVLMLGSKDIDLINLWHIQRPLPKWKRTWRKDASRHVVDQWSKGTGRCKKSRWHSSYGYDPRKRNKNDV